MLYFLENTRFDHKEQIYLYTQVFKTNNVYAIIPDQDGIELHHHGRLFKKGIDSEAIKSYFSKISSSYESISLPQSLYDHFPTQKPTGNCKTYLNYAKEYKDKPLRGDKLDKLWYEVKLLLGRIQDETKAG